MKVRNGPRESRGFAHTRSLVIVTMVAMAILALLVFFFFRYPDQTVQSRAAIIDQLGSSKLTGTSSHKNQTFVETTRELLHKRFSRVDYYSDNVTVNLYKSLISLNYKLIVWRVHSALDLEDEYVAISTSEKYDSRKYRRYLDSEQLTLCNITGDPDLYFGITPKFVKECMKGRFPDTTIVLMSCNGLNNKYYETAEAFIRKGAKVLISWNGWITPEDNDQGITILLHYLINKNYSVSEAIEEVSSFDSPFYGPCSLDYNPRPEVADYHIPNYNEETVVSEANVAEIAAMILKKTEN